jgi:hypothetical protein
MWQPRHLTTVRACSEPAEPILHDYSYTPTEAGASELSAAVRVSSESAPRGGCARVLCCEAVTVRRIGHEASLTIALADSRSLLLHFALQKRVIRRRCAVSFTLRSL